MRNNIISAKNNGIIQIDDLYDKKSVLFSTNDNKIDFWRDHIVLNVYDTNTRQMVHSINVELEAVKNKQFEGRVFDYKLKGNGDSLIFVFTSEKSPVHSIEGRAI